jgi:succinate dehydrogenase / fumarate reductase iron-sulfur subunit
MNLTLKIWRQKNRNDAGRFVTYAVKDVNPHMSFLEMLDVLNTDLVRKGEDPVAFDHDCREGICGSCGLMINGRAHGPGRGIATCQLHLRSFKDGDMVVIEPWRAKPFPVLKDLVVDRTALDRVMQAGGYVSAKTGGSPDGNAILIPKAIADEAFDAAACIGCGACVAACPNSSAMLFVSAKVSQLALLPQGHPERKERVERMIEAMDSEGFGNCSNTYACEAECPKEISVMHIARLNREFIRAKIV